jgi:AraC family transcriptional regulator
VLDGGRVTERPIFRATETHGRALRLGNEVLSHSPDVGWHSLYAANFREAPFDAHEGPSGHPSLIYHVARPTRVERRIDGAKAECGLIGPGRFCVTPGDVGAHWRHSGNPEILQLYVRRSVYERAAEAMYGCDGGVVHVIPRFAAADPLLEQLALAVLQALRHGAAEDRLYIETIAELVAVHMARAHSSRTRPHPLAEGAISQRRIRRLLRFIEEHLGEDLSLEALATEAGLSPLYIARAFRVAVGQSPHRYVVERRVEAAKRQLRGSDSPIADVALATGFSSQSHLSNWFRRVVGVSPAAYRKGS